MWTFPNTPCLIVNLTSKKIILFLPECHPKERTLKVFLYQLSWPKQPHPVHIGKTQRKQIKKNATVKQFLLALIANPKAYTLQKQGFESILNLYQVCSSLS